MEKGVEGDKRVSGEDITAKKTQKVFEKERKNVRQNEK